MRSITFPLQDYLYDPFDFLDPKRKQMLDSSWPYFFHEYLYQELPVDAIQFAFHPNHGHPSKELSTALGVLVDRYLGEKRGYFARVKPSESKTVLQ